MTDTQFTKAHNGFAIEGEITFDTAAALYRQTGQLFADQSSPLRLDLAKVQTVDSAGVALLLEWQAESKKFNLSLHILNAPNDLMRLAALSEAQDLLNVSGRSEKEDETP